jgi:hypothetical protein
LYNFCSGDITDELESYRKDSNKTEVFVRPGHITIIILKIVAFAIFAVHTGWRIPGERIRTGCRERKCNGVGRVFADWEVVSGGRDELAVNGHTSDNLLLMGSNLMLRWIYSVNHLHCRLYADI